MGVGLKLVLGVHLLRIFLIAVVELTVVAAGAEVGANRVVCTAEAGGV